MSIFFGPFYRSSSPTQTEKLANLQKETGQIWGKAGKIGGGFPTVKAYDGKLCHKEPEGTECVDDQGIQFRTETEPTMKAPRGLGFSRWTYDPDNPKAGLRKVDDDTIALIVEIEKIYYT